MRCMRTPAAATLLMLTLATIPDRALAQDEGDIAAYAALSFTPLGGLVPLPPPGTAARGSAFLLRYGNLDFGFGSLHNIAVRADLAAGRGRLGLTLGGTTCDDCDGNIMAGVDYTIPLTQTRALLALRPAFGFSKPLEGDGTAFAFGVTAPIGFELSESTGPIFIPYLTPGLGFGRISGGEDSESGMRPMLGGGLSIAGRSGTFAVNLGFSKVFIDEGETTFGFGLAFGRRSAP